MATKDQLTIVQEECTRLLLENRELRERITLNSYQESASKTASDAGLYKKTATGDYVPVPFLYPALGLAEAGEVQNKIKKVIRDHDGIVTEEARTEIAYELGDTLWYIAETARNLDITLETVAKMNILKLQDRYQRSRISGEGDHQMTVREALALGPLARITHGQYKSRTYHIWQHMKRRCFLTTAREYPDYGGRGITVCDRWKNSFELFLKDMGECPSRCSIDRINNNGNYEPSNCRWSTSAEQAINKRSNRMLIVGGVSMTAKEWADKVGLLPHTIYTRLNKGWDAERAVLQKAGRPRGISA
jgi:NTP pyrophosphatase (non-canonical NTP hydrolase)